LYDFLNEKLTKLLPHERLIETLVYAIAARTTCEIINAK